MYTCLYKNKIKILSPKWYDWLRKNVSHISVGMKWWLSTFNHRYVTLIQRHSWLAKEKYCSHRHRYSMFQKWIHLIAWLYQT